VLERVRDTLMTLGSAIHHIGPVGSGATFKLAVNVLFGIQAAAPNYAEQVKAFDKKMYTGENAFKIEKQDLDVMNKAASDLAASMPQPGLKVGDKAPDFRLPSAGESSISLNETLSRGPVVLVFYRGDWCPYCDLTLRTYQKSFAELKATGMTLLAISPQKPDRSLAISKKNLLEFDVLSDEGCQVAERYGLSFEMPSTHVGVLATVGLSQGNKKGDLVNQIPLPATYVIDSNGSITWAHIDPDYRSRAEVKDILAALHDTCEF